MVRPGSPQFRFFDPFSTFFSAIQLLGISVTKSLSSSAVVELDRDLEGVDLDPALTIGAPRDAPRGPPEDNPDWEWLLWFGG